MSQSHAAYQKELREGLRRMSKRELILECLDLRSRLDKIEDVIYHAR